MRFSREGDLPRKPEGVIRKEGREFNPAEARAALENYLAQSAAKAEEISREAAKNPNVVKNLAGLDVAVNETKQRIDKLGIPPTTDPEEKKRMREKFIKGLETESGLRA